MRFRPQCRSPALKNAAGHAALLSHSTTFTWRMNKRFHEKHSTTWVCIKGDSPGRRNMEQSTHRLGVSECPLLNKHPRVPRVPHNFRVRSLPNWFIEGVPRAPLFSCSSCFRCAGERWVSSVRQCASSSRLDSWLALECVGKRQCCNYLETLYQYLGVAHVQGEHTPESHPVMLRLKKGL